MVHKSLPRSHHHVGKTRILPLLSVLLLLCFLIPIFSLWKVKLLSSHDFAILGYLQVMGLKMFDLGMAPVEQPKCGLSTWEHKLTQQITLQSGY